MHGANTQCILNDVCSLLISDPLIAQFEGRKRGKGNQTNNLLMYIRFELINAGRLADYVDLALAGVLPLEVHLGRLQGLVDGLADAAAVHTAAVVPHVVVELLLDAEERGALAAAKVPGTRGSVVGVVVAVVLKAARYDAVTGAPRIGHEAAVAGYETGQAAL